MTITSNPTPFNKRMRAQLAAVLKGDKGDTGDQGPVGDVTPEAEAARDAAQQAATDAAASQGVATTAADTATTKAGEASASAASAADKVAASSLSAAGGSALVGFQQAGTGAVARTAQDKLRDLVSVKDFGAVGDGVTDDTDAIRAAIAAIPAFGVGTLLFQPGKTYLQTGELACESKNVIFQGNGATLKRGASQTTTLAATASSGATSITVGSAAAAGLEIGGQFVLVNTAAPNGGQADGEISGPHTITGIAGNVVTFTTAVSLPASVVGSWPVGAVVLKVYSQIRQNEAAPVTVFNMTFDGNRANNTVHLGWTVNQCLARVGRGSLVSGCTFHSMPNECIFVGHWATIVNNTAYDLNGSFTHVSSAVDQASNDPSGLVIYQGNRIARAGQAGAAISSHSEGVFCWSANPGKAIVSGNVVENCTQGFTGKLDAIGELIISGNLVRNVDGIIQVRGLGNAFKSLSITDNVFDTALWLEINLNSSQVSKGLGVDGLTISGNQFINTKLHAHETSGLVIADNSFVWKEAFNPAAISPKFLGSQVSMIQLDQCLNYSVTGNILEDQKATLNVLTTAIGFTETNAGEWLKSAEGVNSLYKYYNRNVIIADNQIINFSNGIRHLDARNAGYSSSLQSFAVRGNSIFLRDDATSLYGIRTWPGMVVSGNLVICAPNTDDGIKLAGVSATSKDLIAGEIVSGNTVLGQPAVSMRVGQGTNTQGQIDASWNMTVVNNITSKAIVNANPAQNTVSGNVQTPLTTQTFVHQPSRANPGWY